MCCFGIRGLDRTPSCEEKVSGEPLRAKGAGGGSRLT